MQPLTFHQFAYGSDNYAVLVHAPESGATACVDAGDARAVLEALKATGWTLSHLFITHHHGDHTAGLAEVKRSTACEVIGPRSDTIRGIDTVVSDGDTFRFADRPVQVLHTPGHTLDMVNYHFPEEHVVFTGDTLFAMGCGRLFEGDAPMMWQSLGKLKTLPERTMIYCAHEYTATNAAFALSVDPDNALLQQRADKVTALRNAGTPTVPMSLRDELETNPFLRTEDEKIRQHLGLQNAPDVDVFAELRSRRDNW